MKILQISDIHWTKRKHWNEDFAGMKSKFLEDIKEYIEADNEIDYIFICGDIAFKGIKEEYDKALAYIDQVCEIANCTREDVFVVPGNHDLNRNAEGSQVREMIDISLTFTPNNNHFLDDVVLKNDALRKDLFAAFADYNQFASEFFCQEEIMNKCLKCSHDDTIEDSCKLFYHEMLTKKVGDFNVSIRGVNTALNCDFWDWNEECEKGHKQFLPRRAYVMEKEEKQELRIIMGHHPLDFWVSSKEIKEYIDNHYHIQLFGHVHVQNIDEGNNVCVQSGAFDPPRDKTSNKYQPVYNILEISQKDSTHVVVKGLSQIWNKNKFVENKKGCFEKVIKVERNDNKWRKPQMEPQAIDKRSVKFKFMKLDDRTNYFDKITGVVFTPNMDKTEYDNCLEFLSVLEKTGKLEELNENMK